MIIAIHGKAGHGKDEVGKIMQYWFAAHNNNLEVKDLPQRIAKAIKEGRTNQSDIWEIKKFAGKLKSSMEHKFPTWFNVQMWENGGSAYRNEMTPLYMTRRELLIAEAMAMRNICVDYWVESLMCEYQTQTTIREAPYKTAGISVTEQLPNWIITDMRFPNELERAIDLDGLCVSVTRPGMPKIDSISETSLDHVVGDNKGLDHVIVNDGTIEDLVQSTRHWMRHVKLIS
jgi:hypothetical protein